MHSASHPALTAGCCHLANLMKSFHMISVIYSESFLMTDLYVFFSVTVLTNKPRYKQTLLQINKVTNTGDQKQYSLNILDTTDVFAFHCMF